MAKATDDKPAHQPGGDEPGRPHDDKPQNGNPGGEQIKNLPGQGARRSDQGTPPGGDHDRGGGNRPR